MPQDLHYVITDMDKIRIAKFTIGQVVRHRLYPFRGVIFDIDPEFDNTEEWWESIPEEVRPRKDQPYYHLFAENAETEYIAYVSEQNLLPDTSGKPLRHPQVKEHVRDLDDLQARHYERNHNRDFSRIARRLFQSRCRKKFPFSFKGVIARWGIRATAIRWRRPFVNNGCVKSGIDEAVTDAAGAGAEDAIRRASGCTRPDSAA